MKSFIDKRRKNNVQLKSVSGSIQYSMGVFHQDMYVNEISSGDSSDDGFQTKKPNWSYTFTINDDIPSSIPTCSDFYSELEHFCPDDQEFVPIPPPAEFGEPKFQIPKTQTKIPKRIPKSTSLVPIKKKTDRVRNSLNSFLASPSTAIRNSLGSHSLDRRGPQIKTIPTAKQKGTPRSLGKKIISGTNLLKPVKPTEPAWDVFAKGRTLVSGGSVGLIPRLSSNMENLTAEPYYSSINGQRKRIPKPVVPPRTTSIPKRPQQTKGILKKDRLFESPIQKQNSEQNPKLKTISSTESDSGLEWDVESHAGCNLMDNTDVKDLWEWKSKYKFLLELVNEPARLQVTSIECEIQTLETKKQGYSITKDLVLTKISSSQAMGGINECNGSRPPDVKLLYEQVANLDCLLTSIETQIEVLTTVKEGRPKEFVDTFHDSGTSGHEPDSLEAIETLVEGEKLHQDSDKESETNPGEPSVLLHLEKCAHTQTKKELQHTKQMLELLQRSRSRNSENQGQSETELNSLESLSSVASSDPLAEELKLKDMTIRQLRMRLLRLEKARLGKIPVDAARSLAKMTASLMQMEKARDEVTLQNFTLKSKLAELTSRINDPAATYQVTKELSLRNDAEEDSRSLRMATYKVSGDTEKFRHLYAEFNSKEEEYQKRINELEEKIRNNKNSDNDRVIRKLEDELEASHKRSEATERYLISKEEEYNILKLDLETLNEENLRLKNQLNDAISHQEEKDHILTQCQQLENKARLLAEENRLLAEDFNRERILRKRFYNQVEEMKGKIRVFCRLRPVNDIEKAKGGEVVAYPEDEYSILLDTHKGRRSFVFDKVFNKNDDQTKIFEDTNALVQSALDGFNVTIMAYGQTGSGKTYTMLGDTDSPGIAPRAFEKIFDLIEESQGRQEVSVSAYMLELYNDKLIDLLKTNNFIEQSDKLEVKKDKKGSVYVAGAGTRSVTSSGELRRVFEEGLANRHTASTKLNVSSSRSHLVITVLLTITSKQTGSTSRGKLTLVDLAGSERTQKSGVTNDQLKEANSINKSLSALGDVIAALSSDNSFVPYRNSKLTMLLQDSIGGNAKTLVFVNVSPATFNSDETLVSLLYASRIKQITNASCKNFDTKEVARLKSVIAKLKKGETVDDDL